MGTEGIGRHKMSSWTFPVLDEYYSFPLLLRARPVSSFLSPVCRLVPGWSLEALPIFFVCLLIFVFLDKVLL